MTDDMYSLLAWLEDKFLEAHITQQHSKDEEILGEVISHIKNGSKKELHRTLMEKR